MPALSKKQQKFMGIVRSIQKGEQPASKFSKDAQDVAKDMKKKDVKKFASTKHKGLPMKKEILGKLKELIKQELSEYTYGVGDVVKDVNPTCPHFGAQGKVKSVNPRSVVFVVMNKGKNFKPGMELEKSHDQMKKMKESVNEKYIKLHPKEKIIVNYRNKKKGFKSDKKVFNDYGKALQWGKKNVANFKKDMISFEIPESVNEMSAKTKKIINKLGKKEKEMFMDMVDMLGFDQVMADYKRDKKAFKQALKDMSESVITEKFTVKSSREYFNNLDQALNLIINQANNLKGPLAKHPIKQNINKLKAVKTMLKRGLAPAFYAYEKERHVEESFKGVDITELKKKLQNGKFKSAVEFSLLPAIDTRSYDSNSFYFLKDKKENKLRKRLVDVLYDLRNKMDNAQLESFEEGFGGELNEKDKKKFEKERVENAEVLGYELTGVKDVNENINEDGHTDVASAKRKVMIMVDDSNKLLNKLNGMNKEDSLPSWWTDKITLSQNYLQKATNYLLNPVESVKESMNPSAVKKMRDEFEKTGQLPPHLKKFALDLKILKKKHKVKNIVVPGLEWMSDMKEVNEGKGVEKVLKMANDQSFGKLGGRTVDALSAGLFKGVYDKASDKNKEKINKMNEKQLYVFMTKLWSKFGNQVRIS